MSRLNKAALAGFAAALLAAVVAFGGAPASLVAAAETGPQSWSDQVTCTANSSGYCTIPHPAGVVPDAVTVTPAAPAIVSVDQLTATTFRARFVRAIASNGSVTPLTGVRVLHVHVDWTGLPPASPSPSLTATSSPSASVSPTPSGSPSPSPSPSPTGLPAGWPDASNTGVPGGVTLTPYTGPCTITVAGTTIDGADINCDLTIAAPDVTIIRSRIHGEVDTTEGTNAGLWLQDAEVINGKRDSCQCVGSDHFTMLRVEVVGGNRGVYCRLDCEVRDSWIHGTDLKALQHASAVRVEQRSTIVHNTLQCDWTDISDSEIGCSADLTGYPDFAPIHHNTIDGNLFVANPVGLGFCAYGGGTGGKPYSNDPTNATFIVFTNNTFQRGSNGKCGFWGPITDYIAGRTGNVWTGNVWDDGAPVVP